MTKIFTQAAALALSALMTLAVVTGMDGIAAAQVVKAGNAVMASADPIQVQHVVVVGHRANA